jgi:hypothetical protein
MRMMTGQSVVLRMSYDTKFKVRWILIFLYVEHMSENKLGVDPGKTTESEIMIINYTEYSPCLEASRTSPNDGSPRTEVYCSFH